MEEQHQSTLANLIENILGGKDEEISNNLKFEENFNDFNINEECNQKEKKLLLKLDEIENENNQLQLKLKDFIDDKDNIRIKNDNLKTQYELKCEEVRNLTMRMGNSPSKV